ncbi:MAG TPA: STAS domain-containing protein [Acidobacteriota bacterium]|jgi:anti-sigma B factor antagonist|nr:STAS domain-containing protein [Acidobacteriota bacterium]
MLTFIVENTRELLQKKKQKLIASVTTATMEGDLAVLALAGKIDSSSAALLDARIQELSGQGIRKLVLDLRDVTSMDSAGLGEVIAVYNRYATLGGEVCVAALSSRLKLLFEYAKLHFIFRIFVDVPSATDYLRTSRGPSNAE